MQKNKLYCASSTIKFILKDLLKGRLGKKGFEPLTPWFVATCSSPLSYKPFYYFSFKNIITQYKHFNKNYFRLVKNESWGARVRT